jgi:hypothetical protein
MSPFTQVILDMVIAAGGETTYPALYEALPFEQKRQLPGAIREGKQLGVLAQQVVQDPVTLVNTHKVMKVG